MDVPPPPPAPATSQLFQVFLRLRPSSPQSPESSRFLTTVPGQSSVYVTPPQERNRSRAIEKFAFTSIFDERATQKDVFVETMVPLLKMCIGGRDAALATLGVTGSGKTHTILGSKEQKGMTQMALDVLFASIGNRMVDYSQVDLAASDYTEATLMGAAAFHEKMNTALDGHSSKRSSLTHITTPKAPDVSDITIDLDAKSRYAIILSMYELYNDRIFDLLDESPFTNPSARRKALIFKKPSAIPSWDSSKENKKSVAGLRKVCARNYQEALQILEHGQASRRASPTHSNLVSSRSHAFLQLEIKRFTSKGAFRDTSSLHIVDLAGSERARTAKTGGERLAEAGSINRSLMCLGQCLQLQTQPCESGKPPAVVPWRQSKLTELLFSNSFSGGQSACMIVTADAMGDFNATTQILRYSALARDVTVPRAASRQKSTNTTTSLSSSSSDSDDSDSKDVTIARLLSRLSETESRWREAESRCLLIEQRVREELADEMEQALHSAHRETLEMLDAEEASREGYVDGKLEILKRGLELADATHSSSPFRAAERIVELEGENDLLRRELTMLRRELAAGRSPTRGAPAAGGKWPAQIMALENLDLY